ncbi:MAG: hypothetical protein IKE89_02225 [Bacilli bacterium]|nr:hypothetical protein [Bacilli bacterium]
MVNTYLLKKNIVILDENDYRKKLKGLKMYFKKSYKHLVFEIMPSLSEYGKKDGIYSIDIPIDELFIKCYGKLQLYFSVKNDLVIIEDITPCDILLQCHKGILPIYHGIPYYQERDLFKLKILEKNNEGKI